MEQDGQQKYLPAVQMLREALGYWLENSRAMWLFTAGQVLFIMSFGMVFSVMFLTANRMC